MGRQSTVGIAAQDVHIHLGAGQAGGLLLEAQHLLRAEPPGQLNPKSLRIGTAATLGIQLASPHCQHRRQPIPQGGPLGLAHLPGLDVEVVGKAAAGQHLAMAIQQPAPDRITGHQPDSIFIGPGPILSAVHQLQPGQPRHHRPAEQQHHRQQPGGLAADAAMARSPWTKGHGQSDSSRCSSSSSRSAMRARPCCNSRASWGSAASAATSCTSTFITGLPRPGLTRSNP